ncbi:plasmid pRiA4b ORF-3 family protein [Virgibacillus kekensis]|uniref:Plasmid pRiA4b ORF-3 family protein n=1 Tax=Virgibacillus kekensis TaxID=202261 RepID=A0ABV9DIC2_9BACI
MILEFKITLRDVGVPVWRVIKIDSEETFSTLHKVIQAAFGWTNSHLHQFFVEKSDGRDVNYVQIAQQIPDGVMDFQSESEMLIEDDIKLSDWFKKVNDTTIYIYDFGDDWSHEIVLTGKPAPVKGQPLPYCTAAKNNAPEEDSRGEVMMGEVNLKNDNPKRLIQDINDALLDTESYLENLEGMNFVDDPGVVYDPWEEVLLAAKEFHKLKPWEFMEDDQIFAIADPVLDEYYFCSVLGKAGEVFGLAIYPNREGYAILKEIQRGRVPDFDFLLKQRSILLSFEDRTDLAKEDYEFIKSYDVTFRGKKAWPVFTSYKPGYVPWIPDEYEADVLLEVVEEAIGLCKEFKNGKTLPDFFAENKVLARIPGVEDEVISLDNYQREDKVFQLEVSELDLRRAKKLMDNFIPATIEFVVTQIDMPLQENIGDRPAFPYLAIAVDYNQGMVFFQDVLPGGSDNGLLQNQLLKMLQLTEGIPEKLLVDEKTFEIMEPLIKELGLNVEIPNELPHVAEIVNDIGMLYQ